MKWYIAYKGKAQKGTLTDNLQKKNIPYYIPIQKTEHFHDDRVILEEENVLRNLLFVQTDSDIRELCNSTDGLKSPYYNQTTGQPATVTDKELTRFRQVLELRSVKAEFLQDPYRKFATGQKVRVRAGEFEGMEGYILRMRRDRKLIISVGDIAVAISGIHHTLWEPID